MVDVTAQNARETLGRHILANGMPLIFDHQKSHGQYLHDAVTGKDLLDFFAFFAARPLAFNHPGLDNPEFKERIAQIALHKPSNCDIYTQEYARFVETFSSVALEDKFAHVFFIEGGSPAVENACKAAIDWKHKKNLAAGKQAAGTQIVHFKQCFHGRTGYCLSLTDSHDPRKTQYFPKFDWPRISNPYIRAEGAPVEEREALALAELAAALDERGDDVAAIIIETIQGEGGDNYFRTEFLKALRAVADEREVMLIFDEVQTGFGATGKWWDWQHHDVQPDLMVFGKKTQVCGFASTSRIDEVEGVFKISSRISSTFEGNLVDMVRCTRIIEIVAEEDLVGNAATMGNYLLKVFTDIQAEDSRMSNARGRGLWAAFDMPSTELRDQLIKASHKEALLILPSGTHTVRVRPALDVDADAIGRAGAQLMQHCGK